MSCYCVWHHVIWYSSPLQQGNNVTWRFAGTLVGFEYDIQMFDKFKSLDIFDVAFAVISHVQIRDTVPFEKLIIPDIAQNVVRNFWKFSGYWSVYKCLRLAPIVPNQFRTLKFVYNLFTYLLFCFSF